MAEFSMATNCNSVHDFFKGSYVQHALDWLDKAAPDIFSRDRATARDVLEDLSAAFRWGDNPWLEQYADRITKYVKDYLNQMDQSQTLNSAAMIAHLATNGEGGYAFALAKKMDDKTVEVENALAKGYCHVLLEEKKDRGTDPALEKAMLVQIQDMIGTGRLSQETLDCIADDMSNLFNLAGDAGSNYRYDRGNYGAYSTVRSVPFPAFP